MYIVTLPGMANVRLQIDTIVSAEIDFSFVDAVRSKGLLIQNNF